MALKRYRTVRFPTHYGVIDHGDPIGETVIGPGQAGAGETVPLYRQDGDPENPDTTTTVVFRAAGLAPEDKAAAKAECDRLNGGA